MFFLLKEQNICKATTKQNISGKGKSFRYSGKIKQNPLKSFALPEVKRTKSLTALQGDDDKV